MPVSSPPLVSIIIPLYNAEAYIGDTIQSALNQTWLNKEIIIVNDSSADNSLAVANQFTAGNVKIFTQPNSGASVARNYGLKEAKGQYIQFLDADDLLSPDKIKEQVELLLQHPGKISVCKTMHFPGDKKPQEGTVSAYEESFLYDTDNPVGFLIKLYGGYDNRGSMIQTNAWLTPAEVIKKAGHWSEFYSPDDDGEFFCRVILASKGIIYSTGSYNYYRKHPGNQSLAGNKSSKGLQGKFRSLQLKKESLLKATDSPAAKNALANGAMGLLMETYLTDKPLTTQLLNFVKEMGGTSYVPQLGGKQIELVKKLFGWRAALKLRQLISQFTANKA